MIEISKSQEISVPIESVWKIISDLDHEHKYWSALKDVKILSRSNNSVEREAKVRRGPMGEAKSGQSLVIDPNQKLSTLSMTKGPMLGTRRITLNKIGESRTKIDVNWEFDMKGVPGFALGFVKDGVSEETEKALALIAKEAEKTSLAQRSEFQ